MKVSYFPGCTLKTKAKELDRYARRCAEALGVTLEEVEEWQCCGGVFTASRDEIATKLSSVRLLQAALEKGQPLVTVCSACHNVVKQTNHALQTDPAFAEAVNRYMQNETPYVGQTRVMHYLELLRDEIGFAAVRDKVTDALKGRAVAAYYGCLLLRPSGVMQMDDPENPRIMEDLITAMGAVPVVWAQRNECCGGYITMEDTSLAEAKAKAIADNAKAAGADTIVTACPLCRYNLQKVAGDLKVVYITELLAEALGVKEEPQ